MIIFNRLTVANGEETRKMDSLAMAVTASLNEVIQLPKNSRPHTIHQKAHSVSRNGISKFQKLFVVVECM